MLSEASRGRYEYRLNERNETPRKSHDALQKDYLHRSRDGLSRDSPRRSRNALDSPRRGNA